MTVAVCVQYHFIVLQCPTVSALRRPSSGRNTVKEMQMTLTRVLVKFNSCMCAAFCTLWCIRRVLRSALCGAEVFVFV